MNTGIIIQARLTSKRFPNKVLYPIDGKSIIERVIDKCRESGLPMCVAIPENKTDLGLKYFIKKIYGDSVLVVRGSSEDLILRFLKAQEETGFDPIVRICADSPFISVDDIRLAVHLYEKRGYYTRVNNVEVFGLPELKWYNENVPFISQREHCLGIVGLECVDYPEDIARITRKSPTLRMKLRHQ